MRFALRLLSAITAAVAVVNAQLDDPMVYPQMRAYIEPRQTAGVEEKLLGLPNLAPSCTSAIKDLVKTLPTPPPKLVTGIGVGNDPCHTAIPDTLTSDYTSYSSEIGSWFTQHSQSVSSALSKCPEISKLATKLPVCATSYLGGGVGTHSPATATATATGTETATGTQAPTGTETTAAGGGAARETCMAYAALAVAGMFAVVM